MLGLRFSWTTVGSLKKDGTAKAPSPGIRSDLSDPQNGVDPESTPRRSVRVGADNFAPPRGAEGPPSHRVDGVLGEPHAAVPHRDVHPAGVAAARGVRVV